MIPVIGWIGERLDLNIKQGADFGPMRVTLTNPNATRVDLTQATIEGQIRKHALDEDVSAELEIEILQPPTDGQFTFLLSAETTSGLTAGESIDDPESLYFWDIKLTDSEGRILPLYHGQAWVFRQVTRETPEA